jgi:hypothetical protein
VAEAVFVDPATGRTYTWRQYVATLRSKVRARCTGVTDELLTDAVQRGLTDMHQRSTHDASMTAPNGLLHWGYCVHHGVQRACQYASRQSRKRSREVDAARRADLRHAASAHVDLASHAADPLDLVSHTDMLDRVALFRDQLPPDVRAEVDVLFSGSLRQVADLLGVSHTTVAQRRTRLDRQLRTLAIAAGLLEPDGTYDGGNADPQDRLRPPSTECGGSE